MVEMQIVNAVFREFVDSLEPRFEALLAMKPVRYASLPRQKPDWVPNHPALFGEKEGKIAKASRGRDPLYLFAALQRQLGYPEVPKTRERNDLTTKLDIILNKLRELETRLKLAEGELRGNVDLSQFGKPDLLKDGPGEIP